MAGSFCCIILVRKTAEQPFTTDLLVGERKASAKSIALVGKKACLNIDQRAKKQK